MRVMVSVEATEDGERGALSAAELLQAMGRFSEELVEAGVMLAADGLKPTSEAERVALDGAGRTVLGGTAAE